MEIEKKYLTKMSSFDKILDKEKDNIVDMVEIQQYYLTDHDKEEFLKFSTLSQQTKEFLNTDFEYRIRKYQREDNDEQQFEMTYKSDGNIVRKEVNLPISQDEYLVMADFFDKKNLMPINKTRAKIKTSDQNIFFEVDRYNNTEIKNMVICEVELPKVFYHFNAPIWLGKEISFLKEFSNVNLYNYINYGIIKNSPMESIFMFNNISTTTSSGSTFLPQKETLSELINELVIIKKDKGEITIEDISENNKRKGIILYNNNVNVNNNELTYDKIIKTVNVLATSNILDFYNELRADENINNIIELIKLMSSLFSKIDNEYYKI